VASWSPAGHGRFATGRVREGEAKFVSLGKVFIKFQKQVLQQLNDIFPGSVVPNRKLTQYGSRKVQVYFVGSMVCLRNLDPNAKTENTG